MGLLLKALDFRTSPENPSTPLSAPASWLYEALGIAGSDSGVAVNTTTAMRYSAVYACVNILAQGIASLPWDVYQQDGRSKEKATKRAEHYLLHNEPNGEMTSYAFRLAMMTSVLLHGNFYGQVQRDGSNKVKGIWPIDPDCVRVRRGLQRGRLVYEVQTAKGVDSIDGTNMIHVPCLSLDGISGLSPIQQAKQSIGLGLAAEKMGAMLFGNGSRPSGLLTNTSPAKLSTEQEKQIRDAWQAAYGSVNNAGKTVYLSGDLKWTPMTINPDDAQFLETRQFQVGDIARIFRVPGVLLGLDDKTSTYASAEQFFLSFVTHTLSPWLMAIEQEFNRKLFPNQTDIYCKLDVRGMMRGDAAGRSSYYKNLSGIGVFSPNDIRELEDLNPVEGGDEYFVPLNMVPLSQAGDVNTTEQGQQTEGDPTMQRLMRLERIVSALKSKVKEN